MVTFKAKGNKNKIVTEIECTFSDGSIVLVKLNGKDDIEAVFDLTEEMIVQHNVGGTYKPAENEAVNLFNVIQNYYFDKPVEVKTIGELEELPFEENVIY